jgi:nardilysin
MKLYEKILAFNLRKKLAQASSAGYSLSLATERNGMVLTFSGYNDKMSLFVDAATKFMPKAVDETTESTFEVLKKDLKDTFYENLNTTVGFSNGVVEKLLIHESSPKHDLYHELDGISYENVKDFVAKFLKNLKVQILMQGNVKKADARAITQLILSNLKCEHLVDMFEVKSRCYQLPQGETVMRVRSLQVDDDNSIIRDYYQIGRDTLRSRCLARLVVAILNPKAYDYLRSKEQLGYGVGVQFEEKGRVIGINVLVLSQESKHTYEEVGKKMKTFMSEVALKTMNELTDEEFESFKDARVKLLSSEDLDLDTELKRNMYEITVQEYVFERNDLAVKLTKEFTKQELQEYFRSMIHPDKIRKLSTQVIGNRKKGEKETNGQDRFVGVEFITEKLNDDEKIITNFEDFHKNTYLYPIGVFQLED